MKMLFSQIYAFLTKIGFREWILSLSLVRFSLKILENVNLDSKRGFCSDCGMNAS